MKCSQVHTNLVIVGRGEVDQALLMVRSGPNSQAYTITLSLTKTTGIQSCLIHLSRNPGSVAHRALNFSPGHTVLRALSKRQSCSFMDSQSTSRATNMSFQRGPRVGSPSSHTTSVALAGPHWTSKTRASTARTQRPAGRSNSRTSNGPFSIPSNSSLACPCFCMVIRW